MKKRIQRPIIILLAILLALISAELLAYLYMVNIAPPSTYLWHMRTPLAYAHSADYYSLEFFDEEDRMVQAINRGEDFKGKFFSIVDGERGTSNQPQGTSPTLYMFGNSTLFSAELPDQYTIASYLQRSIGSRYKVINLGRAGMTLTREMEKLSTISIHRGDIVVWYDGASDGFEGYTSIETRRDLWTPGKICNALDKVILSTAKFYCFWTDHFAPMANQSFSASAFESRALKTILAARDYSMARGATFYHFLQPNLWTKPLSVYEQQITDNPYLTPSGIDANFRRNWPILQRITGQLKDNGVQAYDLTHILDEIRSRDEVYIDMIHVNEYANRTLAQAIFDTIWPKF